MATTYWSEVAPGVLRHVGAPVDVNCVLVLGEDRALVVDTGSSAIEGQRLHEEVGALAGARPQLVVNTHAHYDHCFGNSAFEGCEIWASRGCVADLAATGPQQREDVATWWRSREPRFARALEMTPILPACGVVDSRQSLDLGGLVAELQVVGRGHTDHDLVVWLPGRSLLIAGDLVEESGAPQLEDSYPLGWADRIDELLQLRPSVIVPGHGAPVDPLFVRSQSRAWRRLAAWCARHRGEVVVGRPPRGWTQDSARVALRRALIEAGDEVGSAGPD